MKKERKGPLPFSESGFHHFSKDGTIGGGVLWANASDELLVGLLGQSYGAYPPEEWILSGARAELQRRQLEATAELSALQEKHITATNEATAVQRVLLHTIEEFNRQAEKQTGQMLTMTRRIERLTWFIAFLGTAQLFAVGYQIWFTVKAQ